MSELDLLNASFIEEERLLHTVQCFRALACCPPNALSSAMTYGLLVFSSGQEVRVECDFGSKSDQQL